MLLSFARSFQLLWGGYRIGVSALLFPLPQILAQRLGERLWIGFRHAQHLDEPNAFRQGAAFSASALVR